MKHTTQILLILLACTAGPIVGLAQETKNDQKQGNPPGNDRHSRRRSRPQLDDKDAEKLLAHIKQTRPEEYKQLMELKQTQPRRYRWVLREKYRWYKRYQSMPEPVRKALLAQYEARVQIARIRKALADDPSQSQTQALTQQLTTQVASLFDANQTLRKHYLEKLEKKLQRFRKEVKQRADSRDKLIDEQVENILANPALPDNSDRRAPRPPRRGGRPDGPVPDALEVEKP